MAAVDDYAFIMENRILGDELEMAKPLLAFGARKERYERVVRLRELLGAYGLSAADLQTLAEGGAEAVSLIEALDGACRYEAALSPCEPTGDEALLAAHKENGTTREKYALAIPVMEEHEAPMLSYDEAFSIMQGVTSYPETLPQRAAYLASCYALMAGAGPLPFDPARVARLREEPARWDEGASSKRLEELRLAGLRAHVGAVLDASDGRLDVSIRRFSRAKSMFVAEIRGVFSAWKGWEGCLATPGAVRYDVGRELVVSYLSLMEACRAMAPAVEEAVRCAWLYADALRAGAVIEEMKKPLAVFPLELLPPAEAERRERQSECDRPSCDEEEYDYLYGKPAWQVMQEDAGAGRSYPESDPYYDTMQYDHYRYEPTDFSKSWTK